MSSQFCSDHVNPSVMLTMSKLHILLVLILLLLLFPFWEVLVLEVIKPWMWQSHSIGTQPAETPAPTKACFPAARSQKCYTKFEQKKRKFFASHLPVILGQSVHHIHNLPQSGTELVQMWQYGLLICHRDTMALRLKTVDWPTMAVFDGRGLLTFAMLGSSSLGPGRNKESYITMSS